MKVGSEPNITRLLHVITILRPCHQASRRMKGWECCGATICCVTCTGISNLNVYLTSIISHCFVSKVEGIVQLLYFQQHVLCF